MKIHHTIVKAAAAKGVVLEVVDDEAIQARHGASGFVCRAIPEDEDSANEAAKAAWAECQDVVDWKSWEGREGWTIEQDDQGGEWSATNGEREETAESWEDLREAMEATPEAEDEAEDDEDESPRSVVPEHFKAKYAEVGVNGQDNGDFLAREMAIRCTIASGKTTTTDVDKVALLASANGLDREPIEGNNGWQGRYRMTVANMLRKIVANQGFLAIPEQMATDGDPEDRRLPAPAEWCSKWASKPKAKRSRAKKAATPETAEAPAAGEGAE